MLIESWHYLGTGLELLEPTRMNIFVAKVEPNQGSQNQCWEPFQNVTALVQYCQCGTNALLVCTLYQYRPQNFFSLPAMVWISSTWFRLVQIDLAHILN